MLRIRISLAATCSGFMIHFSLLSWRGVWSRDQHRYALLANVLVKLAVKLFGGDIKSMRTRKTAATGGFFLPELLSIHTKALRSDFQPLGSRAIDDKIENAIGLGLASNAEHRIHWHGAFGMVASTEFIHGNRDSLPCEVA